MWGLACYIIMLFAQLYVRVGILLICEEHLHDRVDRFIKREGCAQFYPVMHFLLKRLYQARKVSGHVFMCWSRGWGEFDFTIGFWNCFESVIFFIISFSFCYCICLYFSDLRLTLISSTQYSINKYFTTIYAYYIPNQDLDFQRHMSWCFVVFSEWINDRKYRMWEIIAILLMLAKLLTMLFKLYFHNIIINAELNG